MFEEDTVDLCGTIDVQLHPGWGNNVFDIAWNVPDSASVLDAQSFHTGRDSKTNRVLRSVWVSNYQIGFHRIQASGHAFDGRII